MNIKTPPGYDISHYEEVPDFNLVTPVPKLVICKATEGTTWIDEKFYRFMAGLKSAGIRRGAYHFHRKAYDPVEQANLFHTACLQAGVDKNDILILDVEEGGESAAQLQVWLQMVSYWYPDNLLMIYSRKNILDPIPTSLLEGMDEHEIDKLMFQAHPLDLIETTGSQSEFFRNIPVWTAGYPANPDLYSTVPSWYVPDQTRWGPPWMWQYSDVGVVAGIQGKVDLNWLSPELLAWLGGSTIEDRIEYFSHDRIKVLHGKLTSPREINYHIARFKRSDVDFVDITGVGFLGTGSYYFDSRTLRYGRPPDLIKQMDEGDYSARVVKGLGVSNGQVYKPNSSETNVQWDRNSDILGINIKMLTDCWNAAGGSNWLVDHGEIHWSVLDEPPEYDPRSAIGWDNVYYYWVIIDGRNDGTLGLSKAELAQFFIDIPGVNKDELMAHNNDGGDSNEMGVNLNGEMVILNRLVEGYEKQLVQYGGVWLKEITDPEPPPNPDPDPEPPPNGGDMSDTYITNKRAQLYNANGNAREFIDAGTVMTCDWMWTSGPLTGMRKVLTVNGAPFGDTRFIKDADLDPYTDTTPPDPPPTGDTTYTSPAGSMPIEIHDADGNLVETLHNRDEITWQ